ncbi:uroporphyrinogen-III C-methyltransferase [Persicirhabdus sediminis]|uniref:uroporphyrinogen-III C-methyltransferase n=1 Tax=Persicirhabdus sediminis TaxID=454144 RepID=A0A8J7ME01_9BACT|nr:uroporphyrinogen-III C-methyltransferase [Persicirhabdus sediminis]MBK1790099.1 uroporphyrinogen-III C-methyltransferase [Persicirhabdus sediminis]
MSKQGICYLTGGGPGDIGLVTLKARDRIAEADVLVYDALSSVELLSWTKADCEKINVGKRANKHTLPQEQINALLVEKVAAGNKVVRLKGGDPMIFGRGGEEAEALAAAGLRFEVIPGISSALAGPVYAGIPLTHREHGAQVTIFSGHEAEGKESSGVDYELLAKTRGCKVFLMGVSQIERITSEFIKYGADADTPITLTRWATTGRQKTIRGTLATIVDIVKEQNFKAPAVGVIGNIIEKMDKIQWYENRPLLGKRIVVTRTQMQSSRLSKKLTDIGADVLELPVIRVADPSDRQGFAEGVAHAHTYDWLVFTSPNGVERFFEAFFATYADARSIGGCRIAALGPGTAEKIKAYRFATDLIPDRHIAEGLVEAFEKNENIENQTVLWVRPENARPVLGDGLAKQGAIVDECIAYKIEAETEDPTGAAKRFAEEGADLVTFTSSSTARHFKDLELPWPAECKAASIGPQTSGTLKELGFEIGTEASPHNLDGLVEAIVELLGE